VNGAELWALVTTVLVLLLPQFAVHLFEGILPERQRRSTLVNVAGLLLVPMAVLVFSPWHGQAWVRPFVFLYVFGLLLAGLSSLAVRGDRSQSRATQRRIRFLVLIGALATSFSLADFLWFIGAPLPPVGAVLSLVFLFVLAESMIRERLLDLYEILGQLVLSTVLAFALAGIFYVFVKLLGGFETMYLGAILAAIVILVLFEPLREKVEVWIHKAFFRERVELERAVSRVREELATAIEIDETARLALSALEGAGRATGAALFLRDPTASYFDLAGSFGPIVPGRIEGVAIRPLVDRLTTTASLSLEQLRVQVSELRRTGWARQVEADERLLASCEALGPLKEGLVVSVYGEGSELLGFLVLVDDRVREAFSPDEAMLLESLALHVGVALENSRQYRRLRERDRLAVLGQMAAGLAHEIKNPLGAIKGAAQLLSEPPEGLELDPNAREFVGIILEEVERLDRVVGSVLDYARPSKSNLGPVDLNAVVRRTLQLLAPDPETGSQHSTELDPALPEVRADAEQLRQVLINLVRNAVQATEGRGRVWVSTRLRKTADGRSWAELAVRDEGPGMSAQVRKSLFVPFFTTKDKGTGLGLAISQRMVEEMGGRIDVASQPGFGATFTVGLALVSTSPRRGSLPPMPAAPSLQADAAPPLARTAPGEG
jgi:signal transduction histidine kinase